MSNFGGPQWYFITKYGPLTQMELLKKWQETKDDELYKIICEMEIENQ